MSDKERVRLVRKGQSVAFTKFLQAVSSEANLWSEIKKAERAISIAESEVEVARKPYAAACKEYDDLYGHHRPRLDQIDLELKGAPPVLKRKLQSETRSILHTLKTATKKVEEHRLLLEIAKDYLSEAVDEHELLVMEFIDASLNYDQTLNNLTRARIAYKAIMSDIGSSEFESESN